MGDPAWINIRKISNGWLVRIEDDAETFYGDINEVCLKLRQRYQKVGHIGVTDDTSPGLERS